MSEARLVQDLLAELDQEEAEEEARLRKRNQTRGKRKRKTPTGQGLEGGDGEEEEIDTKHGGRTAKKNSGPVSEFSDDASSGSDDDAGGKDGDNSKNCDDDENSDDSGSPSGPLIMDDDSAEAHEDLHHGHASNAEESIGDAAELEAELDKVMTGLDDQKDIPSSSRSTRPASPPRKRAKRHVGLFGASVDEIQLAVGRKRRQRRKSRKRSERRNTRMTKEAEAVWGLANAAFLDDNYETAKQHCKKCIALSPSAHEPYRTLGLIYAEEGDKENALEMKKFAAHIYPKDLDLWREIADIQHELGRRRQAVYSLGRILRFDAKAVDVLEKRAIIYQELEMYPQAVQTFEKLLNICEQARYDSDVLQRLAEIYHSQGKDDKVVDILENYMSSNQVEMFDPHIVNILAEVRMTKKQWKLAAGTIERHIRRENKVVVGHVDYLRIIDTFPIDLQVKYGIAIIRLFPIPEPVKRLPDGRAKVSPWPKTCFSSLLEQDESEFSDLYLDVADACLETNRFARTINMLAPLLPRAPPPPPPSSKDDRNRTVRVVKVPNRFAPEFSEPLARAYLGIFNRLKIFKDEASAGEAPRGARGFGIPIYVVSEFKMKNRIRPETAAREAYLHAKDLLESHGETIDRLNLLSEAAEAFGRHDEANEARAKVEKLTDKGLRKTDGDGRAGTATSRGRFELRKRFPKAVIGNLSLISTFETCRKHFESGRFTEAISISAPAVKSTLKAVILDFSGDEACSNDGFSQTQSEGGIDNDPIESKNDKEEPDAQTSTGNTENKKMESELLSLEEPSPSSSKRRKRRGPHARSNESIIQACLAPTFSSLASLAIQALAHLGRSEQITQLVHLFDKCRFTIPNTVLRAANVEGKLARSTSVFYAVAANLFVAIDNADEAYDLLVKASKTSPLSTEALDTMQRVVEKLEYPAKVISYISRQIEKWPEIAGYHLILGNCYMARRNYSAASECYDQAAVILPDDDLCPILEGVAGLHKAMNTGGPLRHATVFRGMAFFLAEYQKNREAFHRQQPDSSKDERDGERIFDFKRVIKMMQASYNLGRAFHYLDLSYLAVPMYEEVLELSEKFSGNSTELDPLLSHDAAYNLALIMQSSGAWDLARRVYMKHIVI